MKNKETIIGWVLIILLMIGYTYYGTKKAKEQQQAKLEQLKAEKLEKEKEKALQPVAAPLAANDTSKAAIAAAASVKSVNDSTAALAQYGAFSPALKGEEKLFVIENDVQKITLTSKGGQIKSVELKKYKTWDKKPLILFTDKTNTLSYLLPTDNNQFVDTKELYFEPVGEGFVVSGDSSKTFAMRVNVGNGKYFEQRFTLKGNSYLLNYDVSLVGLNSIIPANNNFISVNWDDYLTKVEANVQYERRYSGLYYKYNQSDVGNIGESKENEEFITEAPLEWISYKQQFFNATLFSSKGDIHTGCKLKAHYKKDSLSYVKEFDARFTVPYNNTASQTYNFQYYFGPNSYNTLASLHRNVQSIIKLSPDFWLFSWMRYITMFIIWVFSWFNRTHLNYGIIILLMTLLLKVVLHPLTAKSIESSAKMKILAPEVAALKEKYGDDKNKLSQEQMKLYSRAGVNQFGGCLPMLVQMPILMSMYYFFPTSIELRQQPFLWATDLSSYDSIISFSNITLPIIGSTLNHISLFTILMTITSVGQAVMNNQLNAANAQQPGMKYMPYIMPLFLMFMFNDFPAALTYYYLLQNLLGIAHQWIIQKFFINDAKLRKQIEENKKNPKKVSGWQKKLADMQRENEVRASGGRAKK